MKSTRVFHPLVIGSLLLTSSLNLQALTSEQVLASCDSQPAECAKRPHVQFYLGGMLDTLGYVNDQRVEMKQDPIYCTDTKALFNMEKILTFMQKNQTHYGDKNTAVAVTAYLIKYGEC